MIVDVQQLTGPIPRGQNGPGAVHGGGDGLFQHHMAAVGEGQLCLPGMQLDGRADDGDIGRKLPQHGFRVCIQRAKGAGLGEGVHRPYQSHVFPQGLFERFQIIGGIAAGAEQHRFQFF